MQIPLGHFQPNRLTGTNIVLRAKDAQKHQLEETDDQYAEILSVLTESLEARTRLLRLAAGAPPWPWIDPEKAAPWVAAQLGLAFAERVAVQAALASKVLVITGGTGVGKTTIIKGILRILSVKGSSSFCAHPRATLPNV
jgi:ABC-type multidrug transport system fused ATPase/permease subunit